MNSLLMMNKIDEMENAVSENNFRKVKNVSAMQYEVVHPLFDIPEEKVDTDSIGPMHMTKTVKWSLIILRGYLIIMIGLAFYRALVLAGIVK